MSDSARISAIVLFLCAIALSAYAAAKEQKVHFKIQLLIEYDSKQPMD